MKKVLLVVFFLIGGLFLAGNSVLANCATGENDQGCLMVGQSCGADGTKSCQNENCGEFVVVSCLTKPANQNPCVGKKDGDSCATLNGAKPGECKSGICWPTSNVCKGTCKNACSSFEQRAQNDGDCEVGTFCCEPKPEGECDGVCKNVCSDSEDRVAGNCEDGFCCKPKPEGECDGTCKAVCSDTENRVAGNCEYGFCCKPKLTEGECEGICKNVCSDSEFRSFGNCEDGFCCKPKAGDAPKNKSTATWDVEQFSEFNLPSGKISEIIKNLVSWLLYLFGFLGIIAFVISGIMYLVAGGDAEQEKKAKLAMKMGIMGIAVGLIGLIVIKAIDSILNAGSGF